MAGPGNRAHPRVTVSATASVSLSTKEGRILKADRIANISLGGVFIEMPDPPGFGAELSIEIKLSNDHPAMRCKGFVAWSTKGDPGMAEGRSGIGVRLMGLNIADMKTLSAYIEHRVAKKGS